MRIDVKELASDVIQAMKEHVVRLMKPIHDRMDGLEERMAEMMDKVDEMPMQGEKGDTGARGEKGAEGPPGPAGADGHSITLDDVRPWLDAGLATWALEFERRAHDTLQRTIDRMPTAKDGRDGADGKDGFGFDDLEMELRDGRNLVVRFQQGERVKEFLFSLPIVLDKGVYKPGISYEHGDAVTYDGSLWIAQKPTEAKPKDNGDWRLAVKRGRNGKDGQNGEKGERGAEGRPGRDLNARL